MARRFDPLFREWSDSAEWARLDVLMGDVDESAGEYGYRYADGAWINVYAEKQDDPNNTVYTVEIGNSSLDTVHLAEAEEYLWDNWSRFNYEVI